MFKRIIQENQLGVEWRRGKIVGLIGPGVYSVSRRVGRRADIFDTRASVLRVPGQEVILSDKISVKVNVSGAYRITDPVKLVRQVDKKLLNDRVTQVVHNVIRDTLVSKKLDDIIEKRGELNEELIGLAKPMFEEIGLALNELRFKDVILPADLRSAYTESLAVQLRSKAQLEQARGQSAALRNLANTAELVERHPQLVHLMGMQKDGANLTIHLDIPSKK